ncbi:MAG TPA: hypothetical protein PKK94_29205, partial [Leptospiraceae bacterium]|nr:hypothetical protein [Leptospiraceae bacterium]
TGTVTNGGVTYSGYRLCLHGGEMRKAEISSRSSCTGLTASDSLSALNWICRTDSAGKVFFYSTGLKQGKYLSDLIDWNTNGWKSIKLTVLDGSTTLMTTLESSSWWGNGLDASNGQNANTSGKIYLYSAIPAGNIRVNTADKVAAVFKPGLLHNSNGGACSGEVILVSGVKFIWIEGYINVLDGTSAIGLNLQNVKFSAVKNFSVQNAGRTCSTGSYYGLSVSNTVNSHFEDIISANTQGTGTIQGMFLSGSSGNTFLNILTMNNEGVGISFASSSNRNVFINALSVSDGSFGAFESSSSTDTVLMNFTSANSSGNGINTSQTNAFLSNLAIVNSATSLT